MSRSNSTGAYQGFSVSQPFLGATLQWLPAVGTQELDDMINSFLPGPSSIQDKRAHISMDFFEYSRQTGENFKFYPVPISSFSSAATSSPASSPALYDSGYGSNFNVSPVIADNQWVESPSTFTPISFDETSIRSPASSTAKRSSPSSSRQHTADFSSHPGMRIMTKDGRDVTNSASRGCKTKEQRDHAHLMRIIKACDSCRRKKIRCDPSHKKRAASQVSPLPSEQKAAKKSKKKAADPPPPALNEFSLDFLTGESLETFDFTSEFPSFETSDNLDKLWDQYVQQDPAIVTNDYLNYIPDDYYLFNDQLNHVSPGSGSSTSSPQVYTPCAPSGPSPPTVVYDAAPELAHSDPTVPYLNPGVPHGTDYVDFNLFSPSADFLLDEEPLPVKSVSTSQRQRDVATRDPSSSYELLGTVPPLSSIPGAQYYGSPGLSQQSHSPGLFEDTQFSFTPPTLRQTISPPGDVRHDSRSPVLDPGAQQQSYSPGRHLDIGPDWDGSPSVARSAVSRSENSHVTVQSTVVVPVRRGTGQDIGQADSAPPGFNSASPGYLSVVPSSSLRASSVVSSSTEASRTLVNGSPTVPGVYSTPQTNVQTVTCGVTSVSTPSVLARIAGSVGVGSSLNVGVGVPAYVSIPVNGQHAPVTAAGSQGHICRQPVVPQGTANPVNVVDSPLNAILATTLLSTLPVRRLIAGEAVKPGQSSSLSSLVCSQLVVFGLVSYLLACLVGAQYLGSFNDSLSTLFTVAAVSLLVVTRQKRASALESAKGMQNTSKPFSITMDDTRFRMQAVGRKFQDFRCTVRQCATTVARRISLPRLASARSLDRF